MKRILLSLTLLLPTVGTTSAIRPAYPPPNSSNERVSSEEGEKGALIKTVSCDWVSDNGIPGTYDFDAAKVTSDNAVKLELYEAVISGKGIVKVKKECATIEGDAAPVYATAKAGKMKITFDCSHDRHFRLCGLLKFFGGNSYTTRKVEIGYLDQAKFIPLKGAPPSSRRLFLRLRGKEYF